MFGAIVNKSDEPNYSINIWLITINSSYELLLLNLTSLLFPCETLFTE